MYTLQQWILVLLLLTKTTTQIVLPLVLNTWAFTNATNRALEVLTQESGIGLDALVEGCTVCEREQCDGTVGFGGSPDEYGETTLDAMIMDGSNMNIGAVAGLRQIKDAINVAKHVLLHTSHTMLVGDQATEFAEMMGFKKESLVTPYSKNIWLNWRKKNCQPNFWQNVSPNPTTQCGPYKPALISPKVKPVANRAKKFQFGSKNHDTIGMIVIDSNKNIFAGTSTNGANHKIPGRVGDSPIPGAGAYADNEVGAATATGDGDIMMRFLPSFLAVENLRYNQNPKEAASYAMKRIKRFYPHFVGGLIVTDKNGNYSAACVGMDKFPFSVAYNGKKTATVEYTDCE